MAANAILQYQTIISRNIDSQAAAVVIFSSVQAGADNNVISAPALLKLNLRWFNAADRNLMLNAINRITSGVAFVKNLPKELYPIVNMKQKVIPLKNDTLMVDKINAALEKFVGPGKK